MCEKHVDQTRSNSTPAKSRHDVNHARSFAIKFAQTASPTEHCVVVMLDCARRIAVDCSEPHHAAVHRAQLAADAH